MCVRACGVVWCAYFYCAPDSRNHRIRMVDCGGPCVKKVYTVDPELTLQVGKYRLSVCMHFYMRMFLKGVTLTGNEEEYFSSSFCFLLSRLVSLFLGLLRIWCYCSVNDRSRFALKTPISLLPSQVSHFSISLYVLSTLIPRIGGQPPRAKTHEYL